MEVSRSPRVRRCWADPTTWILDDGSKWKPPSLVRRFLQTGDQVSSQSDHGEVVHIQRVNSRGRLTDYFYACVRGWGDPFKTKGEEFVLRASRDSTPTLFLSAESVKSYFYTAEEADTLYHLIGAERDAAAASLRTAWRLRSLELTAVNSSSSTRARVERAFNILANPELRYRYDSMLTGDDAPPSFPYAGPAQILVEGRFSKDGEALFAYRIVGYQPETEKRTVSLLLRSCQFLAEQAICRDSRHQIEVWLDRTQLSGVAWDLTWNTSKHWLQSRLSVEATFVRAQLPGGRVQLIALPSRTRVVLPAEMNADIARAARVQQLVGLNADVLGRIRTEVQARPIEHTLVQRWLDDLNVRDVGPELVTWGPDYDFSYFAALRDRCSTWFLFRNEFLFVLAKTIVAEIPQAGHASYVFAMPTDLDSFLHRYSAANREDIRDNRNNAARDLGFITRIVRGADIAKWMAKMLKLECGT